MRLADTRKKNTEIIVDFGNGRDRRTRVVRARLLVNGNCRREADDLIDIRLLHRIQKLAGVGRERLDIPALAFGKNSIKCERRLARARKAGENDHFVARHFDRDVFQVVRPGATNNELVEPAAALLWRVVRVFSHTW